MTFGRLLVLLLVTLLAACTGEPSSEAGSAPVDTSTAGDSIAAAAPGTDIYLAALEQTGDGLGLGALRNATRRSGYDNQPAFAEDGTLLFTSERDGQTDVYRYDLTTDSAQAVTTTPQSEYSPTPRPDGRFTVVRVETDGRQRLWQYDASGTPVAPVDDDVTGVGYHAWIDRQHVALFVLGDPPTLQRFGVDTGTRDTLATRIGRSLQPVPGTRAVSYVQVAADSTTAIHRVDGNSGSTRRLAASPGSGRSIDHAWTPGGTLLMADGTTLYARSADAATWTPVADLAPLQPTRLAVSPDGQTLALVAEDGAGM
jgi:hypothetical protein